MDQFSEYHQATGGSTADNGGNTCANASSYFVTAAYDVMEHVLTYPDGGALDGIPNVVTSASYRAYGRFRTTAIPLPSVM